MEKNYLWGSPEAVLGPLPSNIFYDSVLRTTFPQDAKIIEYSELNWTETVG